MSNKVIDNYTDEQKLAFNMHRIELHQLHQELVDAIPPVKLTPELWGGTWLAAKWILSGEVEREVVENNIREL